MLLLQAAPNFGNNKSCLRRPQSRAAVDVRPVSKNGEGGRANGERSYFPAASNWMSSCLLEFKASVRSRRECRADCQAESSSAGFLPIS